MNRYTPYYCEENTWFSLLDGGLANGHALFIIGGDEGVAVWSQAASPRADGLTMWDYHVVAIGQRDQVWRVLDPDCTAGADLTLLEWAEASFPLAGALPEEVEPRFRAVPADRLFHEFHTDRSHMRDADGEWLAPPPPWPPLSDRSNLKEYLTPEGTIGLTQLLREFGSG